MKKYLLLRNNKRSGPYSHGELVLMDLKPLDLVWAEGQSTSWSHPGELPEFSEIPGLTIISDAKPERKRRLLSQVSLPAHKLPASEFDPAPTLALYLREQDGCVDRSIALQLSLFPSAIYCHVPGGDKQWKAALQLEREVLGHSTSRMLGTKGVNSSGKQYAAAPLVESTTRRSRASSKPVICEFRRSAGIVPQLSKYMKPSGKNMIIRFIQDEDIDRSVR